MNILILNWRDITNPRAGGAELLTREMATRWVTAGHTVTIFSERYDGALGEEVIDGVTVLRRGRWWSVHLLAMLYYIFGAHRSIDMIVDEVHWYPYFSILYAPKKTVLLVCEVAHGLFYRLLPYPVAVLARLLEKLYMFLYRNVPVLAISDSTRDALVSEGFHRQHITVIPMGLSLPKSGKPYPKSAHLTIIVIARLHVFKGVADAIVAFAQIQTRVPKAILWIVGSDSEGYQVELERRAQNLGVHARVKFFGRVPEEKKFELLRRSHILLMPSVHEGWGLVVIEAASQGTPAVGYQTAGVQDVILHGRTGTLVPPGMSNLLAAETLKLWDDRRRYRRYQDAGKKRAISMSWDDSARISLEVLQRTYDKK